MAFNYPFDFYSVHSEQQLKPATIASATTIVPNGFLTFVTGTVQVANITPANVNAMQMIALVFTDANPGAFTGAGNVLSTRDPADNELILLVWDPLSAKWYVDA